MVKRLIAVTAFYLLASTLSMAQQPAGGSDDLRVEDEGLITVKYDVAAILLRAPEVFVEGNTDTASTVRNVTEDLSELVDLITSTVAPVFWTGKGGNGRIEADKANLSLVISQTKQIHTEIADLLQVLQNLKQMTVDLKLQAIHIASDAAFAAELLPPSDAAVVLNGLQTCQLLKVVEKQADANSRLAPAARLYNGQVAKLSLGLFCPAAWSKFVYVETIVTSRDGVVWITVAGDHSKLASPGKDRQGIAAESSLLIDITHWCQPPVTQEVESPAQQRVLLLVTPELMSGKRTVNPT